MANEEHLRILKQGVDVWNRWSEDHLEIGSDPDDVYHNGADFSGANLRFADLRHANLRNANLSEADLSGAKLSKADLYNADLSQADLIQAYLGGADLCGASLRRASLRKAYLVRANLSTAYFTDADLSMADLSQADLIQAYLNKADLRGANLRMANLNKAEIRHANLSGADLSKADISDVDLYGANLSGTDLSGADLRGANLSTADLREVIIDWTMFSNVDLSKVKGLETIKHRGPSTIGIDTIYKSKGNIPEQFLRGAGVPDSFITFMKSLTGEVFDFYSCFISYSSKDQAFVERLYADLHAKGVRCWYAPEDLKIGEPFLLGIEQGIRLHDKLLLVLSEHSVASGWVQHEVLSAMAKEQGKAPWVLFPICVDDAIMNTDIPWATMIKQSRNIGDFTQWKDQDAYQKAFERLLRDLKAEG